MAAAALTGCAAPGRGTAGRRIVILGGGFGGITAAHEARRALGPEHTITLIDRKATFMMGLRKLWIMAGLGTREEGERPIAALGARGIDVRREEVASIDTAARVVHTDGGDVAYDFLLVALGAEPRADLVKGFSDAAYNLYEVAGAERLREPLAALSSGKVAIVIAGVPYKCPPAPYEAAMLIDELFRKRGVRDRVEIHVFTVQPMLLPLLGKAASGALGGRLSAKGIAFQTGRKTTALEGSRVVFDDGAFDADLLIVVPPHRPPAVVKQSGLCGAGEWISVERETLRTPLPGVFAVGDCTEILLDNKMALPKAGIMAEAEARVAAAGIVAEITGSPATRFDGKGYCFVEQGEGRAAVITGDFFAAGAPTVELNDPSEDGFQKKVEFERSRLAAWF